MTANATGDIIRSYQLTITDARDIDGNPYEAAAASFENVLAALRVASKNLEAVQILGRNAELQRQHDTVGEMDASAWEDSVVHKRLVGITGDLKATQASLATLKRAASFDPNGRLDVKQ